jgi:hypothetical protein
LRYYLPFLRGWFLVNPAYPRLAPWTAFFRHFAAVVATDRKSKPPSFRVSLDSNVGKVWDTRERMTILIDKEVLTWQYRSAF